MSASLPRRPFTASSAAEKAREAEDARSTRDPQRVALARTAWTPKPE
jgi:nuclear transport factor 2 (NTF2) superfamily protein